MALRAVPSGAGASVPPHHLETEGAVLCMALLYPDSLMHLRDFLRPEHFYSEPHRVIFEAVLTLQRDGQPIDVVTVGALLQAQGRLAQIGGRGYLTTLSASSGVLPNVRAYAETVYELWRTRQMISTAQRVAAEGFLDHGKSQDWFDRSARDVIGIANKGLDGGCESTVTAIRRILADLMAKDSAPHRDHMGIPYGLRDLDDMTLGLHGKQMTLVVALPGRGKTSFALQVAAHVASHGFEVFFFSVDQVRDELFVKLLANRARVDSKRLMKGKITEPEWSRVTSAVPALEALNLRIDDSRELHVGQIRQRAMAHRDRVLAGSKRPLGLVVVDYIQKLKPAPDVRHLTKREQVAHASEELKNMADDMKIPVLVCAQQKTSDVDKFTKLRARPGHNCVADSSQPEKDAHNIFFLHREPLRSPTGKVTGEDPTSITLIVDKAKVGATGDVRLTFEREFSSFVTRAEDGPPPDDDDEPLIPHDYADHRAGPDT